MPVTIQRPSPPDVTVSNPLDVIYISGDNDTDGSIRDILLSGETIVTRQKRVAGVWVTATDNFVFNNNYDHVLDSNLEIIYYE